MKKSDFISKFPFLTTQSIDVLYYLYEQAICNIKGKDGEDGEDGLDAANVFRYKYSSSPQVPYPNYYSFFLGNIQLSTTVNGKFIRGLLNSYLNTNDPTRRAYVLINKISDPSVFSYMLLHSTVFDTDDFVSAAYTIVASNGIIANEDEVSVVFSKIGQKGEIGPPGGSTELFTYSTNTSPTNPGTGGLRFDNANHQNATFIYLSDLNSSGVSVRNWIGFWGESDNEVKGLIKVYNIDSPNVNFRYFKILDYIEQLTGFSKVMIEFVEGNGTLSSTTGRTAVSFVSRGDGIKYKYIKQGGFSNNEANAYGAHSVAIGRGTNAVDNEVAIGNWASNPTSGLGNHGCLVESPNNERFQLVKKAQLTILEPFSSSTLIAEFPIPLEDYTMFVEAVIVMKQDNDGEVFGKIEVRKVMFVIATVLENDPPSILSVDSTDFGAGHDDPITVDYAIDDSGSGTLVISADNPCSYNIAYSTSINILHIATF